MVGVVVGCGGWWVVSGCLLTVGRWVGETRWMVGAVGCGRGSGGGSSGGGGGVYC